MVVKNERCCIGYLEITANVVFNHTGTKTSIGYDATVQVDTATVCENISCEGTGEFGITCEDMVEGYNSASGVYSALSRGRRALAARTPDHMIDLVEVGSPVPIKIVRAKKLGCCDWPCPDQHSFQLYDISGRVPGSIVITTDRHLVGRQMVGAAPQIDVFDQIMSKFGMGGSTKPTFKSCCTKETLSVWKPTAGGSGGFGISTTSLSM